VAREARVYKLEGPEGQPEIRAEHTSAPDEEPLKRQLKAFCEAVRSRTRPVVSGEDGRRALGMAHAILARMSENAPS
jgi:predicted dehydrogenase